MSDELTESEIEPGRFTLVVDFQPDPDETAFFFEIQFIWDGETTASFTYDSWEDPEEPTFTPDANSAPVSGWASWVNGEDVLIAFAQPTTDQEGWARVDSGAPGGSLHDMEGDLNEPETWMSFARLIHAVVMDEPVQQMSRQSY